MRNQRAGFPLIAVGIAFVALGVAGNRTFLFAGVAFILAALALMARSRRREFFSTRRPSPPRPRPST